MLEVKQVCVSYGKARALKDVSFSLEKDEFLTILGANGAGKSTLLKAIIGLTKTDAGTITFLGEDITNKPPFERVKLGIGLIPERGRIYTDFTVEENLRMGAYIRKDQDEIQKTLDWVFQLFPRLREYTDRKGKTLSGGERQMLSVGRSLMLKPKLLMLDEPSLGLMPTLVKANFEMISKLHKEGVTILLVEQNARMALEVAQRAILFNLGEVALTGSAEDFKNNPSIKKIYLGR